MLIVEVNKKKHVNISKGMLLKSLKQSTCSECNYAIVTNVNDINITRLDGNTNTYVSISHLLEHYEPTNDILTIFNSK